MDIRVTGKSLLKIGWYLGLLYFTYLMLLITLQYLPIRLDAAFLNVKFDVIDRSYYQIAFFSHVFTSIFVLVLGILQFLAIIRARLPSLHRTLGKVYIFLILCIASPSGFVMGIHANGGFWSQFSFCLQAILWFVFTLIAFKAALDRKWNRHRQFMLRSFALTLSAISLRLFKWVIVSTLAWPPMDTYKIVAWLGWVVNVLIVEAFLYMSEK